MPSLLAVQCGPGAVLQLSFEELLAVSGGAAVADVADAPAESAGLSTLTGAATPDSTNPSPQGPVSQFSSIGPTVQQPVSVLSMCLSPETQCAPAFAVACPLSYVSICVHVQPKCLLDSRQRCLLLCLCLALAPPPSMCMYKLSLSQTRAGHLLG